MQLQLALDDLRLADALDLVGRVREFVDVVEVGSPMIIQEGMHAVREFRTRFHDLPLLADTKIMDAGEYEASLAFEANAQYCTVLGVADLATIVGCLTAGGRYGTTVFVDMIGVPDIPARLAELEAVGARHIAVHTGVDAQAEGRTPLQDLALIRRLSPYSILSVAGGISAETVGPFVALRPDIVVVGSGITHAEDPVAAARRIHAALGRP